MNRRRHPNHAGGTGTAAALLLGLACGANLQAAGGAASCASAAPQRPALSPPVTAGHRRFAMALQWSDDLADAARCAGIDTLVVLGGVDDGTLPVSSPALAVIVARPRKPAPPASALRTPGLPKVEMLSFGLDGASITAWVTPAGDGAGRRVLGTISEATQATRPRIHLHWFEPTRRQTAPALIAALEEAYGRLFQLPATASYSIDVHGSKADGPTPVVDGASQAAALTAVADLRDQGIGHLPGPPGRWALRPWLRVRLTAAAGDPPPGGFAGERGLALRQQWQPSSADPHAVAVTVEGDGEVPAEAQVAFSRDPHHVCSARIAQAGRAACRLEDQHGHDQAAHVGEARRPTVATFSGAVRAEVVFLPTTLVY